MSSCKPCSWNQTLFVAAVACLVSFFTLQVVGPRGGAQPAAKESASERILRTHTIRCGYFPYAPDLIVDPNTKEMSGIFYDITQEMARRLGLNVEWTEEVGYGEIQQGLDANRYDLFCNAVWPTPERSRGASFSTPLYFGTVGVFVRADDHRFDKDFMGLNDPSATLAVKDGDITASIAKSLFPKAKFVSVPALALTEQQLIEVGAGKADATFNEPALMTLYNKSADVKLKNVAQDRPLKDFPCTFMMPKGDFALKEMLDVTLKDMISDGFVARAVRKFKPEGGSYFLPAKPYQVD